MGESASEFFAEYGTRKLPWVARRYPRAVARLDSAARALLLSDDPRTYQQVGLLCRDAMIEMIDAAYGGQISGGLIPADKTADRLSAVLTELGDRAASSDERHLVRAISAYAMNVHHDRVTDEGSATRCLFLTIAAIIEIDAVVLSAGVAGWMVMAYGVFRCPECRSRDLDMRESERVAYCKECGWERRLNAASGPA